MAYIIPAELNRRLPLPLETDVLQGFIDEQIARAHVENPAETPYSRQAVASAAQADALEEVLGGGGDIGDRRIDSLRRYAATLFDKHDQMAQGPDEVGAITQNLVSNVGIEPLWSAGDFGLWSPDA